MVQLSPWPCPHGKDKSSPRDRTIWSGQSNLFCQHKMPKYAFQWSVQTSFSGTVGWKAAKLKEPMFFHPPIFLCSSYVQLYSRVKLGSYIEIARSSQILHHQTIRKAQLLSTINCLLICITAFRRFVNSLSISKQHSAHPSLLLPLSSPFNVFQAVFLKDTSCRNYMTIDILRRVLEDYFGYSILFVMNITDVDDKIVVKARRNYLLRRYQEEATDLYQVRRSSITLGWL